MSRLGTILAAAARTVHRFWTEPVRPEPLALFRILLGACLLLNLWLTIIPNAGLLAGPDGLCPAGAADHWLGQNYKFCLLRGPGPLLPDGLGGPWSGLARSWADWGSRPEACYTVFGLFTLSALLLTLGLFTRTATVLTWVLWMAIFTRLEWCMNGGDAVARMALFYLIFARCGAAWSLDRWWSRRRGLAGPEAPRVPPWPLRLMQIQLVLVYLFAGLSKAGLDHLLQGRWDESDWINGQALYWFFNNLELVRWPYHWAPVPLWLCRLASWFVLAFELGFVVLVLFRRARPWLLGAGVLLHLGILVHAELAFFSPFMLCWYALLLPGDRLRRPEWLAGPAPTAALAESGPPIVLQPRSSP